MKKTMKISGLLWALLFAWGGAHAAGLGRLSVQSALGQPLRAEIELLSVSKDELSGINARLAAGEAFRQARIDRAESLGSLQFSVDQRANGQPIVRITSSAPVSDPFLDILIELNWSTGRIIREYTLLLDPPGMAKPAPAQAPAAAPEAQRPSARAATPAEAPRDAEERAKPAARPVPPPYKPTRYGPVKAGETLRSIAGKVKTNEITLEQMMVGLYQANKSAFQGNMNLLQKGRVLNVPDAAGVPSQGDARRTIQTHVAEWHAYQQRLAQSAAEAPRARVEGEAAAGRVAPRAAEQAAPPVAAKDVLKLSKGEPGGVGKPDAKTLERLSSLEEELAAKSRALQEAQDRVGQLERTVQDMQKLLELKSGQVAKAPEPVPAPEAEVPPPAPPTAPAPEPAPEVAAKPAPAPAPLAAPVPVAPEEKSWFSTFISNPLYIGGLVAAVLLSALLWMMMVGSRRRQGLNKFEDSIMTGGEFKNTAVFNTGSAAAAAVGGSTEGSMLLTDFSRLGLGAIDSHEVDPIAEAEVYMAYGRDSQAEEILKEALNKDPARHEIALKLLEIYAARKDPLVFETTASELYAGLGGQNTPVWLRAAELGRSIDPDNPLYRLSASAASAAPAPVAEIPVAPPPPQEEIAAPSMEAPVPAMDLAAGLEFEPTRELSLPEAPAVEAEVAAPPAAEAGLDLEFEPVALESEAMSEAPAEIEPEAAPAALEGFEFPLPEPEPEFAPEAATEEVAMDVPVAELEEPAEALSVEDFTAQLAEAPVLEIPEPEAEDLVAEPLPELDLSSIDLELQAPEEEITAAAVPEAAPEALAELAPEAPAGAAEAIDPAVWEEVNTKLDLARAYMEMGDREGAREILQEVANEGDATQRADAEKLLAEAG